jgi:hypothetical protein
MIEVTLPITFKIGTGEEVGLGGFKVPWVDADDPRNPERHFGLTAGAGVGSSLLEASVTDESDGKPRYLYAKARINDLATALFDALAEALDSRVELRELERDVPAPGGLNEQQVINARAYLGVYCITCSARPGEWCQRLNGDNGSPLVRLHRARLVRLAALDRQGWK